MSIPRLFSTQHHRVLRLFIQSLTFFLCHSKQSNNLSVTAPQNQTFPLPCSPFPKYLTTAFFPLRSPWWASSLGLSLHINDTALTGCDGKLHAAQPLWQLYVRARLRAPELCNFRRSVNPRTAATLLFDSRQVAAPPKGNCYVKDRPRSPPQPPLPRRHHHPGHGVRPVRADRGASGCSAAPQVARVDSGHGRDARNGSAAGAARIGVDSGADAAGGASDVALGL